MAEETMDPGRSITIYGVGGIQTDIDLDDLSKPEVAEVIPELLAEYSAECKDWTIIAGEHWKMSRWEYAEELLNTAIKQFGSGIGRPPDMLALVRLHSMLAHFHLSRARSAPRVILPHAKYDKLPKQHLKEYHFTEATANLNKADQAHISSGGSADDEPAPLSLGKIILLLARGNPSQAQPLVSRQLERQPNNLIALLAQARLQYARRLFDKSLETYQKLLSLSPEMSPDPRIGLGLCLWSLGDKARARLAWKRSQKRDPKSYVPPLLLGLADLNTARDPSQPSSSRLESESSGIAYLQAAFKLNMTSSASALALASITSQSGRLDQASKLAERAIQYSDNRHHTVLANAERGRLAFVKGDLGETGQYIAAAKNEEGAGGVNIMAELTLSQIAIQSGNLREALNYIEQTAKRIAGTPNPLEFTVLHASLLNYPHPGMTPDELSRNRANARRMFTDLHKQVSSTTSEEDYAKLRGVGQDIDIFLDLAKMWQDESLEVAVGALQTAVTASTEEGEEGKELDLKALKVGSNLGVFYQLQGNPDSAIKRYQEGLEKIKNQSGAEVEMVKTVLAFNLARAYEELGEVENGVKWYKDVLKQHPEHMESKVRLAAISSTINRNVEAHNFLKECLKSDESSMPLRSAYTHFLISLHSLKEALAFTTQTLKYDRSDVYTFCALGWIHFTLGREAKSSAEVGERTKQYLRSAEAYERALLLDGNCAMAAQGLAIALAEDTLGLKATQPAIGSSEELKIKMRLAGQSLAVLGRINDSAPDGNVAINMGHCYFIRGEEEKAIQSYEAADIFFKGRNVPNLQYLSRTWYDSSNRQSNYTGMLKALSYAQKALHIQPSDRATLYNIAMIQQKTAEMLLGLDCSKRTLVELRSAMAGAQQAANTFRSLAEDTSSALPYDKDTAYERGRYGDGLLRKAPDQIYKQEEYENEVTARVEEVKRIRAEEQANIKAAEDARRAEIEARASELAEQRRLAQEEAKAYQDEVAAREADDVAVRVSRAEKAQDRKRRKEAGEDMGDTEPRRKRLGGGKKRRGSTSSESEPGEGGEEVDEETKRRKAIEKFKARSRKKNVRREDSNNFKSKAVIEDSDEELGEESEEEKEAVDDSGAEGEGERKEQSGSRSRSRSRSGSPAPATAAASDGEEDGTPAPASAGEASGSATPEAVTPQVEGGGGDEDERMEVDP